MAATSVRCRWRAATAPSQAPVSQAAVAASAASTDLSPPSSMRSSMTNPALSTMRSSNPAAKLIGWRRRGSRRCPSSSYASRAAWAAANFRRVVSADHTANDRQWVALASRLAASGWLSSSSPMIWAGAGR